MKKLSRPFLRPGEFTILLTCFIYPFPVFSSFKTQLKSPLIPLYQRGELHVIISESPPFVKGDFETGNALTFVLVCPLRGRHG